MSDSPNAKYTKYIKICNNVQCMTMYGDVFQFARLACCMCRVFGKGTIIALKYVPVHSRHYFLNPEKLSPRKSKKNVNIT